MTPYQERPRTAVDHQAEEIYLALKALLAREDLTPAVQANASQALAAMWQVMNNLGSVDDFLYDLGL